MLGLLLIYFIGKKFYDLASQYNKNKWGFAIAGIAAYYIGTFIGGVILAIAADLSETAIDVTDNLVLNFTAIVFGLLACVGLYVVLEISWKRKPVQENADILDEEMH